MYNKELTAGMGQEMQGRGDFQGGRGAGRDAGEEMKREERRRLGRRKVMGEETGDGWS